MTLKLSSANFLDVIRAVVHNDMSESIVLSLSLFKHVDNDLLELGKFLVGVTGLFSLLVLQIVFHINNY